MSRREGLECRDQRRPRLTGHRAPPGPPPAQRLLGARPQRLLGARRPAAHSGGRGTRIARPARIMHMSGGACIDTRHEMLCSPAGIGLSSYPGDNFTHRWLGAVGDP
jgi:hypothetical protein